VPRGRGGGLRLALNYLSFALSASLLGPLRLRDSFDVVLVYEPSPVTVGVPALVLKKVKHAPMLFWVQDLWPESLSATGSVSNASVLRSVEGLVRLIYQQSDRILVQSEAFKPAVAALAGREDRIEYFPNTAEGFYRPVPAGPEASHPTLPRGFRVVMAGNMGAAQSLETILAAAELLRDTPGIQWLLVGDGRLRPWLEAEIGTRRLGHAVHLLGPYPAEDMPAIFARADVLLVSLRRDPIFALTVPSKVQSYLACGRPIIGALDGEGARIIEESGAGLVCAADDAASLAARVREMKAIPAEQRQTMGERGLHYFRQEFEREMLLDRLLGWMQDVAEDAAAKKSASAVRSTQ
jgi:colanic acid biosynthesis glycosyl transferase WcaI